MTPAKGLELREALRLVYGGAALTRDQSREVFADALSGEADPGVLGAFLVARWESAARRRRRPRWSCTAAARTS